MAAPTKYPDWALNDETSPAGRPNKIDIPTQVRDSGIKAGELFGRQFVNENFNLIGKWVRHLEEEINNIVITPSSAIIGSIYPVGAVWQSFGNQNPGTQLGVGTWTRVGGYLAGYIGGDNSFGVVGATIGSKTHTHTNSFNISQSGAHTHTVSRDGWGVVQQSQGNTPNLQQPSVAGRLVTGSGRGGDELEPLAHASGDVSTTEEGGHTHSITGGINSASNLPPSTVINIWRRVS